MALKKKDAEAALQRLAEIKEKTAVETKTNINEQMDVDKDTSVALVNTIIKVPTVPVLNSDEEAKLEWMEKAEADRQAAKQARYLKLKQKKLKNRLPKPRQKRLLKKLKLQNKRSWKPPKLIFLSPGSTNTSRTRSVKSEKLTRNRRRKLKRNRLRSRRTSPSSYPSPTLRMTTSPTTFTMGL